MKFSKVIFHIKPIPSHPWWECKKNSSPSDDDINFCKHCVQHANIVCLTWKMRKTTNIFYVPLARKLVFSLQLTVAQCSILRYRGMKCKNWTAHAPIAMQQSKIFFLFFLLVQRWHRTGKALYIWTAHASIEIHYYYTRSIESKWPGLVVTYQV